MMIKWLYTCILCTHTFSTRLGKVCFSNADSLQWPRRAISPVTCDLWLFTIFPLWPVTFHDFSSVTCDFPLFPLWPVTVNFPSVTCDFSWLKLCDLWLFTISPLHLATNKHKLIWRRAYQDGFSYKTIVDFIQLMLVHGLSCSLHTLKRILRKNCLKRRNELSYSLLNHICIIGVSTLDLIWLLLILKNFHLQIELDSNCLDLIMELS